MKPDGGTRVARIGDGGEGNGAVMLDAAGDLIGGEDIVGRNAPNHLATEGDSNTGDGHSSGNSQRVEAELAESRGRKKKSQRLRLVGGSTAHGR
ncbi:MAG TPA: hypothetical protein VHZ55_04575 [Bryobacteraceae bacterium]|nr:hypothetical protein [Bryobacteraceae bacterium]